MQPLEELRQTAESSFASCASLEELDSLKVHYLGKKSPLSEILKQMGALSIEEKRERGAQANSLRDDLNRWAIETAGRLDQVRIERLRDGWIDVTLPGCRVDEGRQHILSQTAQEILEIVRELGFDSVRGPEIEHDFYNFEALNIPQQHPAREMQDTFYLTPGVVLRTQTSPVQIRAMLARKEASMRVACLGKVFRHDQDSTHSPMFHQIELLALDDNISFADLKGTLTYLIHKLFSSRSQLRLRPSYFPFTEPSAEVDISCFACDGKGCRLCKQSGWIEILGSGIVHPFVLRAVGLDPEKVRGFAVGMGLERIAMLRHGIDDIRYFFENDQRFLSQF
ncbi:MAG: phenylalanine--tRNA ligase subunit alpha [Myxococcaceae bacterium]|nr:phenylalanine--tRNA ligase subunit alpha [Myxococcaceae bacterium]MBH2006132.1 phenylalanine--tRNA ligase subunit alpha [Myxococcaceae bacterium]